MVATTASEWNVLGSASAPGLFSDSIATALACVPVKTASSLRNSDIAGDRRSFQKLPRTPKCKVSERFLRERGAGTCGLHGYARSCIRDPCSVGTARLAARIATDIHG